MAANTTTAPALHPCGPGCTDSDEPVSECECECLGANHARVAVPASTPATQAKAWDRLASQMDYSEDW